MSSAGLRATFVAEYKRGPRIDATVAVDPGEVVVLFGPSGGGKSTVLRAVAGLHTPSSGRISCGGEPWFDSSAAVNVTPQRRRVAYLSQDYALFPHLTVAANITYSMRRDSRAARAAKLAELVDLLELDGIEQRRAGEISGGQAQRVALGRALATNPALLLLDEPLSAIDGPTRAAIRGSLRSLLSRLGIPTVIVTHERSEALALADNLTLLVGGRTLQSGPINEVMANPASLDAARALGFENFLPLVGSPSRSLAVRSEHIALHDPHAAPTGGDDARLGVVIDSSDEGPHRRTRLLLPDNTVLTALVPSREVDLRHRRPGCEVLAVIERGRARSVPNAAEGNIPEIPGV